MSNYCWVFVTLVSLSHFDQLRPKLKKNVLFTDASCNFDIWYCGWENGPGSRDFTWTRKFGPTPSRDTGPSRDHTSGAGKGYLLLLTYCNTFTYHLSRSFVMSSRSILLFPLGVFQNTTLNFFFQSTSNEGT